MEIDWDHPGGGGGILSSGCPHILVCLFRVPGGCLFDHRSKGTGGGIKMAAAISTVEVAILQYNIMTAGCLAQGAPPH